MENSGVSIFQLITRIEQILKGYDQAYQDTQQLQKLMKQLKKLHLSPEIIFQQLIPNRQQLTRLKLTIFKQILRVNSRFSLNSMEHQTQKALEYQQDRIVDSQEIHEIIQKLCAIKGQTMFVNQELSVQSLEEQSDSSRGLQIEHTSLRKLIKQFMRKCKSSTRLHFLTPLCIRLIVLQETVLVYLEKSLSMICSILEDEREQGMEKRRGTVHTFKSVSSLSASIEHFLQKQNKNNSQASSSKASIHLPQCRSFKPVIRSDFILDRQHEEQPLRFVDNEITARRENCCLWF